MDIEQEKELAWQMWVSFKNNLSEIVEDRAREKCPSSKDEDAYWEAYGEAIEDVVAETEDGDLAMYFNNIATFAEKALLGE